MPNIKSAKKRVKVNAVKAANNKARNTALKTAIKKANAAIDANAEDKTCLLYTSPSPRDISGSRMPSSA